MEALTPRSEKALLSKWEGSAPQSSGRQRIVHLCRAPSLWHASSSVRLDFNITLLEAGDAEENHLTSVALVAQLGDSVLTKARREQRAKAPLP